MNSHIRRWLTMTVILLCFFAIFPTYHALAATALRKGDTGEAVLRLQTVLQLKGYFTAKPTGLYGDITVAAVKAFQKDNKLKIDGIAGDKTLAVLYETTTVSRGERNEDILWLARIIHAEAQGESYTGKVAVGNVVMNRVASRLFPNNIYEVIFQYTGNVPQFSPVADGSIMNTPARESELAAWDAYAHIRNEVGDCMYFFNPKKAAGTWMVNNCEFYRRIGNHDFYR